MSFFGIDLFGLDARKQVEEIRKENWKLAADLANTISLLEENQIEIPSHLLEFQIEYKRTMFKIELFNACVEKIVGITLVDSEV